MIGKVSWYSSEKRFGFLTAEPEANENGTRDYFFHQNDLVSAFEVKGGDRVQFELGERSGRIKAVNVVVVE